MQKKSFAMIPGLLLCGYAHGQCELITEPEATNLIGPDVSDMSGDDAAHQCLFLSNSTGVMLIAQFANREYFNQVTLNEPFQAADIGEEGRSRIDANGGASVQFLNGATSVTMTVRPTRGPAPNFLPQLLDLATLVAGRIE